MKKRNEKRRQRVKKKTEAAIEAYRTAGTQTDPNGMYTGNTNEIQSACTGGKIYMNLQNSMPTQDADDL